MTSWVTTVFDPKNHYIEFCLIFDDIAVLNREIQLKPLPDNTTACEMKETMTLFDRDFNNQEINNLEIKKTLSSPWGGTQVLL